METAFVPPVGIALMAVLGALFAAILPTCLYLYVEPRGRDPRRAEAADPALRRPNQGDRRVRLGYRQQEPRRDHRPLEQGNDVMQYGQSAAARMGERR